MTVTEAKYELDPETLKSAYDMLQAVKNQIAWLEYVPEHELTKAEQETLIAHGTRLFCALRVLTAKYID